MQKKEKVHKYAYSVKRRTILNFPDLARCKSDVKEVHRSKVRDTMAIQS